MRRMIMAHCTKAAKENAAAGTVKLPGQEGKAIPCPACEIKAATEKQETAEKATGKKKGGAE